MSDTRQFLVGVLKDNGVDISRIIALGGFPYSEELKGNSALESFISDRIDVQMKDGAAKLAVIGLTVKDVEIVKFEASGDYCGEVHPWFVWGALRKIEVS